MSLHPYRCHPRACPEDPSHSRRSAGGWARPAPRATAFLRNISSTMGPRDKREDDTSAVARLRHDGKQAMSLHPYRCHPRACPEDPSHSRRSAGGWARPAPRVTAFLRNISSTMGPRDKHEDDTSAVARLRHEGKQAMRASSPICHPGLYARDPFPRLRNADGWALPASPVTDLVLDIRGTMGPGDEPRDDICARLRNAGGWARPAPRETAFLLDTRGTLDPGNEPRDDIGLDVNR